MLTCCLLWLAMLASVARLAGPISVLDISPAADRKASVVVGTVVSVDAAYSVVTIRQVELFGNRRSHVASYRVEEPAVLPNLRPGDRIMGTLSANGRIHISKHTRKVQPAR